MKVLCLPLAVLAVGPAHTGAPKPKVSLRAAPRIADVPARILFTVQLTGGHDSEALHCLTLQWDWGDGTRSRSEGDCSPFEAGRTEVQRMFQADHEYRTEGKRTAGVKVMKGGRVIGSASTGVAIYPAHGTKGSQFESR